MFPQFFHPLSIRTKFVCYGDCKQVVNLETFGFSELPPSGIAEVFELGENSSVETNPVLWVYDKSVSLFDQMVKIIFPMVGKF